MDEPIPTPVAALSPRSRFPRPTTVGLIVAVIAVAGLIWTSRRPLGAPEGGADPQAASFRLASLDGRQLGPADFEGKVVLVDFWATWCVPCHLQGEILARIYAGQKGRPVEFLAVSVGEEESVVREFAASSPIAYPVLLDPTSRVADALDVVALPTLMVLDRNGKVVLRESGLVDEATIEDALAAALSS